MTSFPLKYTTPFINNAFLSPSTTPSLTATQLINPATESPLPTPIHEGSPELVDRAVESARSCLSNGTWGTRIDARIRRDILLSISKAINDNTRELTHLECLSGKPYQQSKADIEECAQVFAYFAGLADKLHGRTYNDNPSLRQFTIKEPIGVVGLVTSFNYPLVLSSWKLAPALACGNAVIIKPAPQTPLSTLYLAHLISSQTSLPPGVLSVIPGGDAVGKRISTHPQIDKISFTGSTSVGKQIMIASGNSNLKKVTLELGGKSAIIVTESADLTKACNGVYEAIFANMGQNCCAGSRLLIHKSVYETFLNMFRAFLEMKLSGDKSKQVIGDPLKEETLFGPLVDAQQFERVRKFVDLGVNDDSIQLFWGGRYRGSTTPPHSPSKHIPFPTTGYYIEPTIFTSVPDSHTLSTQEIFGPVLCVNEPFITLSEAIQRANNTPYGLASGIFTEKYSEMDMFFTQTQSGIVWVNGWNWIPPGIPFGGVKESGFGKDLGPEALEEYCVTKSVIISL